MKAVRLLSFAFILIFISSCGNKEKVSREIKTRKIPGSSEVIIPVDKGFSEYITGHTSGIVPVNTSIEIHFTPEFAALAGKRTPPGLFTFEPALKGKTEWTDDVTLVFTPNKILDPATSYSGKLNLEKLAGVKERLKIFPVNIRTIKKDFIVNTGILDCSDDGSKYSLNGELTASDYINSTEVETYLKAKLGRKKLDIVWDHSDMLVHKFSVINIERKEKQQKIHLSWDGSTSGVKQKGNSVIDIPSTGDFSVIGLMVNTGESQSIDVVFSDPLDPAQDTEGMIWLSSDKDAVVSINSNIAGIFPSSRQDATTDLYVETAVKNTKGKTLSSQYTRKIDFSPILPAIELSGNGVILPSSKNLIFPFKTANLKAVDMKIIKIFENNLPHFLQENDINGGYSVKRFGKPLWSGRIDLVNPSGKYNAGWNLHTVDLSDYIDVEPGILYKVELSMRPSYSLYPCDDTGKQAKYEEMLNQSEQLSREYWDDPDNYYSDSDDYLFYSFDYNWQERNDPCKVSYYSPDKKVSRNILASNFGIIAKKGTDNTLHVMVNDLLTALPLSEVNVEVFDYQLQQLASGNTNQDGQASLPCNGKPFLVIAKKDKDRNYLKITDGSSLSLSSFDVSGNKPENGIKAFIYGERDVWRPGDSIYLSIFLKDIENELPPDHPVQFELTNPLDQKVDNQVQQSGGKSLLVFRTKTPPDAATGNYTASFRIGGALFTKRVRVETIKPNRLKLELAFPGKLLSGSDGGTKGTLKVKWLNGSVAGNLNSIVEYILKPVKTEFQKYPQYNFDDPSVTFNSESVRMFDGNLDENGDAIVTFNPGKDIVAPGMLNSVFTARVAEKGGDESITQAVYQYAPYPVFVGIDLPALKGKQRMLYTDADNQIKIVTVDQNGKPVNSEAEITISKISYRWWWESDQEDLATFMANETYKPVVTKTIRTSGGEGSFSFKIGKEEWGRYLIRATLPEGHSTGKIVLVDWPWEYGMKGNSEGATLLTINTDKEKYNPGDEIRLTFPTPENAMAIVTLENSTSVLDVLRVITSKGNTVVTFKAKAEMAPNIYAYVTVIQPHDQTVNDMPMRLYGVVPVMVEDKDTRLKPVITMPDQVRSGQSFEIKVSEAARKPMTYTLAVVDEGLLDITGFKTPDPWNYFYAREALGVKTWDLYDFVLGAFGGTLDRLLATGGDEALIDRSANKAQRFTPVVRFMGPFTLNQGKTRTHKITLPQYTGSVKTMVIAGNDRAFGFVEKNAFVRDPLMILVTAPRVVSPGEKVALPVTLFIQKKEIKTVAIVAEGNDLAVFDEKMKSLSVKGEGEKNTGFSFTAGAKTGIAKIRVTATGGGESATYELEINVRNPNPPETRTELKVLQKGEKWETSFTPFGINGSDAASLEVSALPSVNLEKWLGYLIEYPHGCTEQITSTAFPQLWAKDIAQNKSGTKETASANIREAITKIVSRQMINGGISLWPGNYQPDNWVTSYAGHFMTEAARMGYNIPSGFRQKWLSYQKRVSNDWRYDPKFKQSANDQAYRLFTLALAGEPERGAMNRLREASGIPQVAKWMLAAAFSTSGRPEVADALLDMRILETEDEYSDYYYGSKLRDKAIVLYTLSVLKKEEEALHVLKSVCDDLNNQNWLSTQSLAWGLFSSMKFTEMVPQGKSGQAKFTLSFNGESSDVSLPAKKIIVKDLKQKQGTNRMVVQNTSDIPLYINLVRKGIPLVSDAAAVDKGLGMKADYFDMEMKPVDHTRLQQGTDFLMVVKVTNKSFVYVGNIALTQMVPSGWEILNTRLFESNYGIKESTYDYRDFRDDRVNTYFGLNQGETKTFVLVLNAAYRGEFNQPALSCEAMYNENCYSRIPGKKVTVTGQEVE